MYNELINYIRELYPNQNPIQLHAPVFHGNEKKYLNECIDSTYVSYVGRFVNLFEEMTAEFTGAKYAVAVVNGTAALQIALQIVGVENGDEVITQPLTFVATANAIKHVGAEPIFIDVDLDTMGLSPSKLSDFLEANTFWNGTHCINKISGKKIKTIIPMHTFGHSCKIDEIVSIANKYNLHVVEDAAESLGSYFKDRHTGTFGIVGILSYNGNKTITTGGGGMIITNDESLAKKAKHITTTGKIVDKYEYVHDVVAYNYRMTNVNAAIGVAQMEYLNVILDNKRETALLYESFCRKNNIKFYSEPINCKSNYWLNAIVLENRSERNRFLDFCNDNKVIARPIWRLMSKLEPFKDCHKENLESSEYLEDRIVNLPSGYRV